MDDSNQNHGVEPGVNVTVYGTRWCAATQMIRRYLDRHQIAYEFKDIDYDMDANHQVKWWAGGNASHPTVQIGGEVLIEPSTGEVERALESLGAL
jgi:mycoredoxin